MNYINAIAKARFSSAKPQRVQLHAAGEAQVELLCLEANQVLELRGPWSYYVIAGQAEFTVGSESVRVPAGQLAISDDEPHSIANRSQQRLVCLAIGKP